MFIRHLNDCLTLVRHSIDRRTFVCRIAERQALIRSA
jgi:hypothetical protein